MKDRLETGFVMFAGIVAIVAVVFAVTKLSSQTEELVGKQEIALD